MSIGRKASARSRRRSRGQMYRAVTIPQATKLREVMARALTSRLLTGPPAELAEQFGGLLWGTLMISLLLGVAERPSPRDVAARARDATTAFLQLHPPPKL